MNIRRLSKKPKNPRSCSVNLTWPPLGFVSSLIISWEVFDEVGYDSTSGFDFRHGSLAKYTGNSIFQNAFNHTNYDSHNSQFSHFSIINPKDKNPSTEATISSCIQNITKNFRIQRLIIVFTNISSR